MKRRAPGGTPESSSSSGTGVGGVHQHKPPRNNFLPCPFVAATVCLGIGLAEVVLHGGLVGDLHVFDEGGLPNLRSMSSAHLDALPSGLLGHTKHGAVFVTVKTARKNHRTRVSSIIDTYWNFAPQSIAFISDNHTASSTTKEQVQHPTITMNDPPMSNPTKDRFSLVDSTCPPGHGIEGLCCKTAKEIEYYHHHSTADWMCHLDDDTYVNFPALLEHLKQYNATEDHFIGYGSVKWPVYTNKDYKPQTHKKPRLGKKGVTISMAVPHPEENEKAGLVQVSYATGGAGWCLSRPLVERGINLFTNFVAQCQDIGLPDDVTLGFVIQEKLGVTMKLERKLHSHLDEQKFASLEEVMEQLTFGAGYGHYNAVGGVSKLKNEEEKHQAEVDAKRKDMGIKKFIFPSWPGSNLVDETTGHPPDDDPLAFRALHCQLYPEMCSVR